MSAIRYCYAVHPSLKVGAKVVFVFDAKEKNQGSKTKMFLFVNYSDSMNVFGWWHYIKEFKYKCGLVFIFQ